MNRDKELVSFADLSPMELRALQMKLAGILEAFDLFCRENGLCYYLVGGTLIGAVRHKGFVPWDDDLDVAMPREDYEKMFLLWDNKRNRYKALRPSQNILTGVHIGLIRDSETTCIYDYARDYDICHGLKIDIEPIDGCPESKLARRKQKFFCLVYGLMSAQRVPNHGSVMNKKLAKIILSIIRSKKLRYRIFSFAETQVKKYRISECKNVRIDYGYTFNKNVFGSPQMAEFEGKMYPIPYDYDTYLKRYYGDYMSYPPQEQCKPMTKVSFYDPDNSYKKYKGIEYCIK